MLRDTILKRGKDLVLKGEASYAEKENIEHLYEQYKALGGNGIIDKLYKEVLELPLI